jgi:hypothetical protein
LQHPIDQSLRSLLADPRQSPELLDCVLDGIVTHLEAQHAGRDGESTS